MLEEDKQVQLFLYGARAVSHEVLKILFVEEITTYSYDDIMKIASIKLKGSSIISKSWNDHRNLTNSEQLVLSEEEFNKHIETWLDVYSAITR